MCVWICAVVCPLSNDLTLPIVMKKETTAKVPKPAQVEIKARNEKKTRTQGKRDSRG